MAVTCTVAGTSRGWAELRADDTSLDSEGADAQVLTHETTHLRHSLASSLYQGRVVGGADSHSTGIGVADRAQAVERLVPRLHDLRGPTSQRRSLAV